MTNKDLIFAKILEYSWLTISISSAFTCIHTFHYYGATKDFILFGVISLLALAMFYYRRLRRKKIQSKK